MTSTDNENRWNHNIHYHAVVLGAVPPRCERALDVGCGEGLLARQVAELVSDVTALDPDEPSLRLARAADAKNRVNWVQGDFLTYPFDPESFDFISSVASLHHIGTEAGLARMRDLLRPGGTLVVIGLATPNLPADLPRELLAAIMTRWHKLTKTYWETPAPKLWPPPATYSEVRHLASGVLPGVIYRRHVLWRYSLTWRKPGSKPSA